LLSFFFDGSRLTRALLSFPIRRSSDLRGPKTALDDDALLALIRANLAASPFIGEGHRKVHARLHFAAGHKVGRNRVLRLMRAHRSEEHTSELQSLRHLVCRLPLEKKKQ